MHYWSVTTRTLNKMQIHTIASTKTSRLDLDLNIACLRMPERTLLEAKVLSRVEDGSILLCGEWRRRHGWTGWTEEDLTHLYIFRQWTGGRTGKVSPDPDRVTHGIRHPWDRISCPNRSDPSRSSHVGLSLSARPDLIILISRSVINLIRVPYGSDPRRISSLSFRTSR